VQKLYLCFFCGESGDGTYKHITSISTHKHINSISYVWVCVFKYRFVTVHTPYVYKCGRQTIVDRKQL